MTDKFIPPFRRFVIQNFPFIEADFDALTSYQLWSKVVEYLNKVIKSQNEITAEMQQYIDYINNYFDDLDVTEEIDAKLDEMAENGELADIIAAYIELRGILAYNSVADMKNADNLVAGSFAETYGFYTKGDGGGAKYLIRTVTNEDVIDNIHLHAIVNDNSLVAELIKSDKINVKVYGAKGDGVTDDTSRIQAAINDLNTGTLSNDKESILLFPCGTYKVTDSLDFTAKKFSKITGKAEITAEMAKPIIKLDSAQWLTFEDLYIRNTSTSEGSSNIYIVNSYIIQFNHLYLRNGDIGLHIYNGNNLTFNSTTIREARVNIYTYTRGNNTGNSFNDCAIEDATECNFYVKFVAAYYGIYNFNNCYFEFSALNAYIEQAIQVNFDGCFMSGMSNDATFFEVNDFVALDSYLMRIYCNSCRLYTNDGLNCYLVKSLNSNIKSCLTLDNNCYIRSTINLYNLNDENKPTITCKNPELLDVYNANSLVLDSNNIPLGWTTNSSISTITPLQPYFEGSENSLTFGESVGYFIKKVFLKAGVTYKIEIANKAVTGSARFDIFNDDLTSRLMRVDNSSTNPTVSSLYFVPSTSARYAFLVRNTGSDVTSSFSGMKVYSLEPKVYNFF